MATSVQQQSLTPPDYSAAQPHAAVTSSYMDGKYHQELFAAYQLLEPSFKDVNTTADFVEQQWNRKFEKGLTPFDANKLRLKEVQTPSEEQLAAMSAGEKRNVYTSPTYTGNYLPIKVKGESTGGLKAALEVKANEVCLDISNGVSPLGLSDQEVLNLFYYLAHIEATLDNKLWFSLALQIKYTPMFQSILSSQGGLTFQQFQQQLKSIDSESAQRNKHQYIISGLEKVDLNAQGAQGATYFGTLHSLTPHLLHIQNTGDIPMMPLTSMPGELVQKCEAPELSPKIVTSVNNRKRHTFRLDPSHIPKQDKMGLFSDSFNNDGSITEHVSQVFQVGTTRSKTQTPFSKLKSTIDNETVAVTDKERQAAAVLHLAARVLERDLHADLKTGGKQYNLNATQEEVMYWTNLKNALDAWVAKHGGYKFNVKVAPYK